MRLKTQKILLSVGIGLVVLGIGLPLGLHKTITLSINGQTQTSTSYALTVGGFLRAKDIPVGEQDYLDPPLNSWLKNHQTITLVRAIPVNIWVDGELVSITSPSRHLDELLSQAGVSISPGDQILSKGYSSSLDQTFSEDIPSISLQINRSITFTLVDGESTYPLTTSASTIGEALWDAGINYTEADHLDPPSSSPVQKGLVVHLTRARPITIQTRVGKLSSYTTAETVGGALAEAGLALQGLDFSSPAATDPIPSDGEIRLVRVREEVLIEQAPLPFETQYQPVSDLEIDQQTILQAGEYGLTATRLRVRYEDEIEVSRIMESEWVAKQPLPRIVGYGTQIVMHTAEVDGNTIQYWRKLEMWATSYHPSEGIDATASGLPLQKGVVAVDIRYIPFYTKMFVPGYGEAIAGDTGSGVIGRWIDLGYRDEDYVPWHSYVTVYFLWPPPDNVVWIIP